MFKTKVPKFRPKYKAGATSFERPKRTNAPMQPRKDGTSIVLVPFGCLPKPPVLGSKINRDTYTEKWLDENFD
ncbi:hypothetical protein KB529_03460 [Lactococcus lactis subsp. lactis]|uniref:hypothetical protein n=1 Tax=Lactococcus lactis TaxID=1358 RepID=UPI001BB0ABFF|nr:hypothetical protein [Lactococcus lactis]MBS3729607.1 hypothetical protein [Lactococcus lactis subsp. lactis]